MEHDNNEKIQEILERLVRMETKLDDFTSLRNKTDTAYTTSQQNAIAIKTMQGNITWCWRTVLGAIIAGLIGLFIKLHGGI